MEALGFSRKWISWVQTLYTGTEVSVLVNGKLGESFELQRSVRQGCPLAPYLFILASDVLGYMLENPKYKIQGFRTPKGNIITSQMSADDTAIYLQVSKDNLNNMMIAMESFCKASGAKINWHKSRAIWASNRPRTWTWGEDLGLIWLQNGQQIRYLGFPMGFKVPQSQKDKVVVDKIRGQLLTWTSKKFSLRGRVLVSNQVIAASIWYLASCLDVSNEALKQVRAMLRNYVWAGKSSGRPRAKVAWQQPILPLDRGGLKLLDPEIQASALLVKLLTRGLTPGAEPWKDFIAHRAESCQQLKGGRWPKNSQWLMTADKILKLGSDFWMGTWRAWKLVRKGVIQSKPQHWAEIIRQPLFGNNFIRNAQGNMLGMSKNGRFRNWAKKGLSKTLDIWDPQTRAWMSRRDLNSILKTPKIAEQSREVLESIPWDLGDYSDPIQTGDWLVDVSALPPPGIIHVQSIREGTPWGWSYFTRPDSDTIHKLEEDPRPINTRIVTWARVATRSGFKDRITNFNPKENPPDGAAAWVVGRKGISDLVWDLKEWRWEKTGGLPEVNFCEYTSKRGYRIGLN